MKLTIKRSKWLRGEGSDESYLLRQYDGKMCCLGFLGLSCGLQKKNIEGVPDPESMTWGPGWSGPGAKLINKRHSNSRLCTSLMATNDNENLSEGNREKKIKELFKKIGVQVIFVD